MNTTTPRHIAIIPDGNRRWAKEKNLPAVYGHKAGYTTIEEIVEEARLLGVLHVTVWAFSTENWKRSPEEKEELFHLIQQGLLSLRKNILKKKSRFVHLGRRDRLSTKLCDLITTLEDETKEYKDFTLCVAIDYGGEDEIARAVSKLMVCGDASRSVHDFLDTALAEVPPPDLVIRTSGEKRTSGFMPLQSAYSEWFFFDCYFPDFTKEMLRKTCLEYSLRERRFGK